jgi:hypothetical protein
VARGEAARKPRKRRERGGALGWSKDAASTAILGQKRRAVTKLERSPEAFSPGL